MTQQRRRFQRYPRRAAFATRQRTLSKAITYKRHTNDPYDWQGVCDRSGYPCRFLHLNALSRGALAPDQVSTHLITSIAFLSGLPVENVTAALTEPDLADVTAAGQELLALLEPQHRHPLPAAGAARLAYLVDSMCVPELRGARVSGARHALIDQLPAAVATLSANQLRAVAGLIRDLHDTYPNERETPVRGAA